MLSPGEEAESATADEVCGRSGRRIEFGLGEEGRVRGDGRRRIAAGRIALGRGGERWAFRHSVGG